MADEKDKVVGYRQQGGKLPFPRPGSGGSRKFSEPRDEDRIARPEVPEATSTTIW